MLGIYCRISGKKAEGKDVSIEDQEAQGIKFAKKNNLPYKVYKDIGISGAKDEIEDRPDFAEMFNDIQKRSITSLFVVDQSRIERNSRIWQIFSYAVVKFNCAYFVNGKSVNLDNEETKFTTGIISLTNELYASLTSRKVKSANRHNALKGKGHGITAYGYQKDNNGFLIIDEVQAENVRDMFKWSLEGIGSYTIANKLNDAGIATKSAQFKKKYLEKKDNYTGRIIKYPRNKVKWRGNVVFDMLRNPIYKGQRKYGDVVAKIDAVVSEEMWNQVNKNFKKNKKNVGPKSKYNYLLNGLIFCGDCGAEFKGKFRKSSGNNSYYCKGNSQGKSCKDRRGLNIYCLESFVIHHLFHSKDLYNKLSGLQVNENALEHSQKVLNDLLEEKKGVEKSKLHLGKLLRNPDLSDDKSIIDDYLKTKNYLESLTTKIDEIKNVISDLATNKRQIKIDKIFQEFDFKMNFEQIKESIHGIVENITIKHLPEQKLFMVQLDYKGFEERSIFITNYKLMNWSTLHHYEVVTRTEQDKQDDSEQFDYLAAKYQWTKQQLVNALKSNGKWQDEWVNFEQPQLLAIMKQNSMSSQEDESIINIKTKNIELAMHELYKFNTKTS
jgi:site-specific DNA recombinase